MDSIYKRVQTIFAFFCLISLGTILSRFIYVATNGRISFFLLLNNNALYTSLLSIHTSLDTGYFHVLPIMNNDAINMREQLSLWDSNSISFGSICRSGVTGSYGSSIFNFLSSLHRIFHSGFYSPTNSAWSFSFLYIFNPLSPVFLVKATIIVERWYFIMVLTCIFLMVSDVEHLLMKLLVTWLLWRTVYLSPLSFFKKSNYLKYFSDCVSNLNSLDVLYTLNVSLLLDR